MATSKTKGAKAPEKKIGPFAGGIGVAIWLNTVDSAIRAANVSVNSSLPQSPAAGRRFDYFAAKELPTLSPSHQRSTG